jgi:CxxC motif-containing protein (DUF1111 family)
MKNNYWIFCTLAVSLSITACLQLEPSALADEDVLDGPVEGLSTAQTSRFVAGDIAFNDQVFTRETGLGPLFITNSCGSCHAGDGKGHPFSTLIRFGQTAPGDNTYLHLGGPQLQTRAIPGYEPEILPEGTYYSKFTPPANTGLGYLELVPDSDLLAMSDPQDIDGDGISGRPNWIQLPAYITARSNAISMGNLYIHRFGKKAAAYDLLHQTVNAYNQDMGITSTFHPFDTYSGLKTDPEVSNQTIHDLVFYLQTLKAPVQRNPNDPNIQNGKTVFINIGCEKCHKQTLHTAFSGVNALSDKDFHPYTDLLLHDVGAALNDNYTEGQAENAEWRTPPLWGLGLSPQSQGGQYFLMHDGRAKSIEEAIKMHAGESQKSTDNYNSLTPGQKQDLILFLKSL